MMVYFQVQIPDSYHRYADDGASVCLQRVAIIPSLNPRPTRNYCKFAWT